MRSYAITVFKLSHAVCFWDWAQQSNANSSCWISLRSTMNPVLTSLPPQPQRLLVMTREATRQLRQQNCMSSRNQRLHAVRLQVSETNIFHHNLDGQLEVKPLKYHPYVQSWSSTCQLARPALLQWNVSEIQPDSKHPVFGCSEMFYQSITCIALVCVEACYCVCRNAKQLN